MGSSLCIRIPCTVPDFNLQILVIRQTDFTPLPAHDTRFPTFFLPSTSSSTLWVNHKKPLPCVHTIICNFLGCIRELGARASQCLVDLSIERSYNMKGFYQRWPKMTSESPSYTLPTPAGAGHWGMESTSIGCNQWFSRAKITPKMPHAGRNRSLVASTDGCGEGISVVRYGCDN
jgi:hypothetical protein